MSIGNVDSRTLLAAYPYVNQMRKSSTTGKISFADMIKQTAENSSADRTEVYKDYLKQKYGNVTFKNVSKDHETLERLGKRMSGNDVVIAPNIVEEMANDPEKAAYYEGKIDDFFNDIPRKKAMSAAQGLVYQPCGVVIHEDGSVTYISGCSNDTPETRAKIKAEQEAKRKKQEKYRLIIEETANKRRQIASWQYQKPFMAQALQKGSFAFNARTWM